MWSFYELMKPLLAIGCATKGTGNGRWKAKTPNQTITFTSEFIGYHEYVDATEDTNDSEISEFDKNSLKRNEKCEFMITKKFIKNVRLEGKRFIITNIIGEEFAWELEPAGNQKKERIRVDLSYKGNTNFKEAV